MTQKIKIVAIAQPKFITSGTVYVQDPNFVGGGGGPATPSLGTITWTTSGDTTDTTPSFGVPYLNLSSTQVRAQYDAQSDAFVSPIELTPQTLSGNGTATFTTGVITPPFTGQFRASIDNGVSWTTMSGTFQVTTSGGGSGNLGNAPTVTLLTGTSNLPGFDIRLPVGVIPVAGWKIRLNPAPAIGTFSGAPFDYTITAGDVAGYDPVTREFTTPISWSTGAWPAGTYNTEISYLYPTTESAKAIVPVTVANASSVTVQSTATRGQGFISGAGGGTASFTAGNAVPVNNPAANRILRICVSFFGEPNVTITSATFNGAGSPTTPDFIFTGGGSRAGMAFYSLPMATGTSLTASLVFPAECYGVAVSVAETQGGVAAMSQALQVIPGTQAFVITGPAISVPARGFMFACHQYSETTQQAATWADATHITGSPVGTNTAQATVGTFLNTGASAVSKTPAVTYPTVQVSGRIAVAVLPPA